MRMWMVDPEIMCRQHLLGEHVEIHMLIGSLKRHRRIDKFLDKGLLDPENIVFRHFELAIEMISRGFQHNSDISQNELNNILLQYPHRHNGHVNIEESLRELIFRCPKCYNGFWRNKAKSSYILSTVRHEDDGSKTDMTLAKYGTEQSSDYWRFEDAT